MSNTKCLDNLQIVSVGAMQPERFYATKPLNWFIGRNVKINFRSPDTGGESMWVSVTHCDGDELVGILDSVPIRTGYIRYGDRVVLTPKQILAVDLSLAEWREEVAQLLAEDDEFKGRETDAQTNPDFERWYYEWFTPRWALRRWMGDLPLLSKHPVVKPMQRPMAGMLVEKRSSKRP